MRNTGIIRNLFVLVCTLMLIGCGFKWQLITHNYDPIYEDENYLTPDQLANMKVTTSVRDLMRNHDPYEFGLWGDWQQCRLHGHHNLNQFDITYNPITCRPSWEFQRVSQFHWNWNVAWYNRWWHYDYYGLGWSWGQWNQWDPWYNQYWAWGSGWNWHPGTQYWGPRPNLWNGYTDQNYVRVRGRRGSTPTQVRTPRGYNEEATELDRQIRQLESRGVRVRQNNVPQRPSRTNRERIEINRDNYTPPQWNVAPAHNSRTPRMEQTPRTNYNTRQRSAPVAPSRTSGSTIKTPRRQ